ncbi:MAG: DUF1501 domain-containing protein [Chitinophagaceae bacterium]|nr:DUF1501 domain-containing protein [Chitinophagaceae bacterium]
MKRRDFLKMGSLATLAYTINGMPIHTFGQSGLLSMLSKNRSTNGNILVLIRMSGGNDGLNTIIPLDKYSELSVARPNLLINQPDVLPLNGSSVTGMHPAMTALQNMYNNGKVNIIQGVSYPDPNFSHFRATDIMFSAADSNTYLETGWVGRYIDNRFPGAPQAYPDANFLDPLSVEIGSSVSSMFSGVNGLNGLAISSISSFYNIVNGTVDPAPATPAGNELTYIRFISQQTQAYTQVIQNAANLGTNMATYPANNNLADQLKIVARLISGGLKTPVYMVNIGGFDTHDNQVDALDHSTGFHADLLKKLSDAIGAFQQDLELLGKDDIVAGCTFSEFGRRIKSNASDGSDHGSGMPMMVFGKKVNPTIIGSNPVIPASATVNDNVAMQHDFRQIYSTILSDWLGLYPSDVTSVLNGQSYQWLPIFKWATGQGETPMPSTQLSLEQNFPNPFRSHTTIRFTHSGGAVQILLYDEMGRMLRVLYENDLPAGTFDVGVERDALPAGNYFYQLHTGSQKMSKKMVIVN